MYEKLYPLENPYRKQQAWIDRDFRITKLPANLNEGYFIQQPHIIPKDTEISIVVTGKSKIYVALGMGVDVVEILKDLFPMLVGPVC